MYDFTIVHFYRMQSLRLPHDCSNIELVIAAAATGFALLCGTDLFASDGGFDGCQRGGGHHSDMIGLQRFFSFIRCGEW